MNRQGRRFGEKRLRKAALESRPLIVGAAKALREKALTEPGQVHRAVIGCWTLTMSYGFEAGVDNVPGFVEVAKSMLGVAPDMEPSGSIWHLAASLAGRPRSSCDDDWVNLGMLTKVIGVREDYGRDVVKKTDPNGIFHFIWTEAEAQA